MKYIRHRELGILPFDENLDHKEFAASFGGRNQLISAGFMRDNGAGEIKCYGESVSLMLSARDEDTRIAQRMLFCVPAVPSEASASDGVLEALFSQEQTAVDPQVASTLMELHSKATPGQWDSNCGGEIFATVDGQEGIRIGHFQGCAADAAAVCAFHNNAAQLLHT